MQVKGFTKAAPQIVTTGVLDEPLPVTMFGPQEDTLKILTAGVLAELHPATMFALQERTHARTEGARPLNCTNANKASPRKHIP